ncbi:MAG: C10 family peptidase [Candidatus Eisenbacteria bacterium]|nr:C10 family peptidase [Candidatus Eisenbacteria bacterium]
MPRAVGRLLALFCFLLFSLMLAPRAGAVLATPEEMEAVARNWMALTVQQAGDWGGSERPEIAGMREIRSGGRLLGRVYSISPTGHIAVPVLKELPPVKCYSEKYDLDPGEPDGFPRLLREALGSMLDLYEATYGSLDASQPSGTETLLGEEHRQQWDGLLLAQPVFQRDLEGGRFQPLLDYGPLLSTEWHQSFPYNLLCPQGDGGQCVVGCVATAAAQVLRYYQWPPIGLGESQYYWEGDDSCGGGSQGDWLYADFSDPFDWQNMPADCDGGCTQQQRAALSELCYEVGVAFQMDYGVCGSGAYTSEAITVLPQYFRYDDTITEERRNSYSASGWSQMIRDEVAAGRPMLYAFRFSANEGHAVVCDGWRLSGGEEQYHINYGWGGSFSAWYAIDHLYHTDDPMQEVLYRGIRPSPGMRFTVAPDGGGDYATIQAAIDVSLDGDTIELLDGLYRGDGNRDLVFGGREITVRSRSDHPEDCTIDCEGNPGAHRAFLFTSGETAEARIRGVTITGGYPGIGQSGGAILCSNGASPVIENCVFEGNEVASGAGGGAIACAGAGASPRLVSCTFRGNQAQGPLGDGGAVAASGAGSAPLLDRCVLVRNTAGRRGGGISASSGAHPIVTGCTFHANGAASAQGAAVWVGASSAVDLERSILGFGASGGAVACEGAGANPSLSCCDVYGNAGGDWVGCIAGQSGMAGNLCADPLYCGIEQENLRLTAESPCAEENNPECGGIGAMPAGCGLVIVLADGTGDYPTIQAAMDAAEAGFVVELGDGVYRGPGNRDLDFRGKTLIVRSRSGDPDSCVIDCQGTAAENHRGFEFHSGEGSNAMVSGLTIRNGYMSTYSGGGISCTNSSNPTIEACNLYDNRSDVGGGGLFCFQSRPTIRDCTFAGNTGGSGGGAYLNSGSQPIRLDRCTFSGNAATAFGGAVFCYYADLVAENCIFAFSSQGSAFYCFYSSVDLRCCDVFGNVGGDYAACIAGESGADHNLSVDPQFCDRAGYDFGLMPGSPCNDAVCGRIGAWPVGCGVMDVEEGAAGLSGPPLDIAAPAPNPFASVARIPCAFRSAEAGRVTLRIFDASGRSVRQLIDEVRPAGRWIAEWDGRNDAGDRLAAGVYLARLEAPGAEGRSVRIVLLK